MWDGKPDRIPASVPNFPHDLGLIPRAQDFQATSAPIWAQAYPSRAWCGRMLTRLKSQTLLKGITKAAFLPPLFQPIFQRYWGEKEMLHICASLRELG